MTVDPLVKKHVKYKSQLHGKQPTFKHATLVLILKKIQI